nr:M23 family metallopeptidase [Chloroflexota bacterium]
MRNTILVQQEEVRTLSQQVEEFQIELASISALSNEIRELIGLPASTTTPIATLAAYFDSSCKNPAYEKHLASIDSEGMGGLLTRELSERSMALAMEKSQDIIGMQFTLPSTFRELLYLREQVLERMEKIEPEKRSDPAELERQLRLLAAAPHLWPTAVRRISSKFGYRTLYGTLEFHNGIDIPIWYGSQVFATKDGVVTKAGWQAGYGWIVEIEHDMGFTTIYGHNSKLLVKKGDEVKAGDVIALSGSSGRSTGPHLHYEIRLNDVPVDPLKYLDTDIPYVITK